MRCYEDNSTIDTTYYHNCIEKIEENQAKELQILKN